MIKRRSMMVTAALATVVNLLTTVAVSQTNEEPMVRALKLVRVISPGAYLDNPRIERIDDPLRITKGTFSFFAAQVSVSFTGDGKLLGFRDMSDWANKPSSGREKFASDDRAWQLLYSLLGTLDPPKGLTERSLSRVNLPYAYEFVLLPKPYGYGSQGGNSVYCRMNRVTGRVSVFRVSRGWSYEPPNVRVTKEQALEQAFEKFGAPNEKWTCALKYWAVGSEEAPIESRKMYARKTLRLHYVLNRRYLVHQALLVDSVTGKVVDSGDHMGTDQLGRSRSLGTAGAHGKGGDAPAPDQPGSGLPSPTLSLAIGTGVALLVAGGVVLMRRTRVRR